MKSTDKDIIKWGVAFIIIAFLGVVIGVVILHRIIF